MSTSWKVAAIPAAIALFTAVAVAWIGHTTSLRIAVLEADARNLQLKLQQEEVALKKDMFLAEQYSREERTLSECISKLVGDDNRQKQHAVALLFALYPNDAQKYLDRISSAVALSSTNFLNQAVAQAQDLNLRTGDWAIRLEREYQSIEDAEYAESTLEESVGVNMSIYRTDKTFRLVIGRYESRDDATAALIALEPKLKFMTLAVQKYAFLWMKFGRDVTLTEHVFHGTVINLKDTFPDYSLYGRYYNKDAK